MTQLPLLGPPPLPPLDGDLLVVASMIYDARPHPVKSKDIARRLQCDSADVRHMVSTLVDEHALPIGGDRTRGYRLCETRAEFIESQMAQLRQAATTLQRVRGRIGAREMREALRRMGIAAVIEVVG